MQAFPGGSHGVPKIGYFGPEAICYSFWIAVAFKELGPESITITYGGNVSNKCHLKKYPGEAFVCK
jgi:hypothetical protein